MDYCCPECGLDGIIKRSDGESFFCPRCNYKTKLKALFIKHRKMIKLLKLLQVEVK